MELFCRHCNREIHAPISLMQGVNIPNALRNPVHGLWHAECPACHHRIDFIPPAGHIVVCFADDDKRPESFKDNFDGQDIVSYYTFNTLEEFLMWWIPQTTEWEGMWYYVLHDGTLICSGAVDPYDIEIWRDHFGHDSVNQALDSCAKKGIFFDDPDTDDRL